MASLEVLVGDIQKAGRGFVDEGGRCFFDLFFSIFRAFLSIQLRLFSPRISSRAILCSTCSLKTINIYSDIKQLDTETSSGTETWPRAILGSGKDMKSYLRGRYWKPGFQDLGSQFGKRAFFHRVNKRSRYS